jgi:peptidoglycan/LPS O-acetylase OafA/YrhL
MIILNLPGIESPLAINGDIYSARDIITVTQVDVLNSLTMRNGLLIINGPLWSLYVEVKLYMLAGLLAFAAKGNGPLPLRLAIATGGIWYGQKYGLGLGPGQTVYAVWWFVGCAFFLSGLLARPRAAYGFGLLGALAIMILHLSTAPLWAECGRIVVIFALSYAVFFVIQWADPSSKAVADYSYTLYLVHFPILLFFYALLGKHLGAEPADWTYRTLVSIMGCLVAVLFSKHVGAPFERTALIKQKLKSISFKRKTK